MTSKLTRLATNKYNPSYGPPSSHVAPKDPISSALRWYIRITQQNKYQDVFSTGHSSTPFASLGLIFCFFLNKHHGGVLHQTPLAFNAKRPRPKAGDIHVVEYASDGTWKPALPILKTSMLPPTPACCKVQHNKLLPSNHTTIRYQEDSLTTVRQTVCKNENALLAPIHLHTCHYSYYLSRA